MIHYSKLGRYVKINSESEIVYAFKLVCFDCYETTYIPGRTQIKTTLMNEVETNNFIEKLTQDSFEQLDPISLVDLHNKKTWAKLILEYYNKIVPQNSKKTKQIKI